MRTAHGRGGAILILVAGIIALLASLAYTFLARMRSDAEEMNVLLREGQARMMLTAGCNYVLEAGRIGWDAAVPLVPGAGPLHVHHETFGWIDVRDGATGPIREDHTLCWNAALAEDSDGDGAKDRPAWPAIGGVARCPMYVMSRPPFADQMTVAYNPISQDPTSPDFGMPYLRNPDPQPEIDNGWSTATPNNTKDNLSGATFAYGTNWKDYALGDPRPRGDSLNLSWFRIYRDGPATFIITCGAGASEGFKDWNEVRGASRQADFNSDPEVFAQAVAIEARAWYRVQWSPHCMAQEYSLFDSDLQDKAWETYMMYPMNASSNWNSSQRSQLFLKNCLGTIAWVQRLPKSPTLW